MSSSFLSKFDGARFNERRLVYLSAEYKLSAIRFAPNSKPLTNASITISVCIAVCASHKSSNFFRSSSGSKDCISRYNFVNAFCYFSYSSFSNPRESAGCISPLNISRMYFWRIFPPPLSTDIIPSRGAEIYHQNQQKSDIYDRPDIRRRGQREHQTRE